MNQIIFLDKALLWLEFVIIGFVLISIYLVYALVNKLDNDSNSVKELNKSLLCSLIYFTFVAIFSLCFYQSIK